MLAHYVVEQLEDTEAKVQLPTASAYGVYLPSRLHCRWLNSGFCVLPLIERMFCLRVGQLAKPISRGPSKL
jgi:hypothetical protein